MFHVKPHFMKFNFKRFFFASILFLSSSINSFSQKEGDISLGLSLDYGFGKDFNNYASGLRVEYNLFERFRIAPQFTYYLNKEDMKMVSFSFNFHYLFPELLSNYFPALKNQGVCFYPVAGFLISNFSHRVNGCSGCSANGQDADMKYLYNFGFDFGAGIEYEIPTLLPILRDMVVNFEVQYQLMDNYTRPLVSFGLLYNF